ncbi:MAG: hypothetical protein M3400_09870 [Actinomycetota bacterium]|nr:hypothetical protein [Actinomycetota bacterium]
MRRALICFAAVVLVGACSATEPDPPADSPADSSPATSEAPEATDTVDLSGLTGQIVFQRATTSEDEALIHTMNPDGSQVEELFPEFGYGARSSPDGTEISLFCCGDGMAAHIVDVETGELRTFPMPDPALETNCGPWSPDGTRLTCASFGVDDPSLNGIYSINAADGGDLRRITSAPDMGDFAGDYSPDGSRLVFQRDDMEGPIGIFVTNVDGTGLMQLTPPDMVLDEYEGYNGRWSPTGDQILFVAPTAEGEHKAIWIVSVDGGEPQQLPITPACGGPVEPGNFGCYSPSWSPDGEHIVFVRSDGTGESLFIVNADGSGLVQVTEGQDDQPHWGPPP